MSRPVELMLYQGKDKHEAFGKNSMGGHAISIRDQLATISEIVDFSKDWANGAVKASLKALAAWSIVCLGLSLLSPPARIESSDTDGLVYVASRMQFCIAVVELRLPSQCSIRSTDLITQAKVHNEREACLVELHQLII